MPPFIDMAQQTTGATDVVVVGRGAIGSLLAARLVRVGLGVRQVSSGLRLGARRLKVCHGEDVWHEIVQGGRRVEPSDIETTRLVILAIKTTQVARYLRDLTHVPFTNATRVTVHNGLPELGTGMLPVFPAVVKATADCNDNTVVCHAFDTILLSKSALLGSASALQPALERAGCQIVSDETLQLERWLKLVVVTTGARMVLANASIGEALGEPTLRSDLAAVAEESGAVLAAGLPDSLRRRFLAMCNDLAGRFRSGHLLDRGKSLMRGAYPSLHRDLEHGRETEIESLNGAIVRQATRMGMEAPLNRFLADEIRALTIQAITPAMAARTPDLQRRLRSAFTEVGA